MIPEPEEEYGEEEPAYPSMYDLPDPDHRQGPLTVSQPAYDADMLNFLQHTVADSFYPELIAAIDSAAQEIGYVDQLGGIYPRLSRKAVADLKFVANTYVAPPEYVVTNVKDVQQFRAISNNHRADAKYTKSGCRKIDFNNTFTAFLSAMGNHLTGAKLTRSYGGFERVAQQTQRAELSSTYEHKKPPTQTSGLSRLLGRG